jgi:GDP-4-dehydro-6-deoxy-D-mannose reductase
VRALVTGAAGFVGWHLVRHLAACGDQVLGVQQTASPAEATAGAAETEGDGALVAWDIAQSPSLETKRRITEFAPEAIYHLAAISIPADCGLRQPTPLAQAVNVGGTERVLALAESLDPQPRVLVVSSAYVYGPVSAASAVVHEDSPLAPNTAYGMTKLATEERAREAAARGLGVVIARAFNHTGPRQSPRMMLPEWCRKFAAGDDPVVVKCREAWLDLIDVRDVVRAYRLLVERGRPGETYNVGGGIARRSGDVLDALAALADPRRRIEEADRARRQNPIADIQRLQAATAWRPEIELEQTIADTYGYWQSIVRAAG